MFSNGRIASSDKTLAGQSWQRASYLCPLPLGAEWLHELARPMRSWWPLWFIIPLRQESFLPRIIPVWASGAKLIAEELKHA